MGKQKRINAIAGLGQKEIGQYDTLNGEQKAAYAHQILETMQMWGISRQDALEISRLMQSLCPIKKWKGE